MPTLTKAGRYEISGELGRGAMGVVYHATDPVIGRAVAVKTLLLSEEGTGLTRAELLAKFQTEPRPAALLTPPTIVVLFHTPDDHVNITDFGTAKILQFGTVQQTAHVVGTPSYMSPEQIKGKVVDGRSDIFSLGVVLYEMVTGEKPFPGQNIPTVIYKIVNEEPTAPRDIDSSIHPALNTTIFNSLPKTPPPPSQTPRDSS